ncbi:MAG: UvrD-helicase domain-containing protein [Bacteroidaceae bacterium]|nr:UvrD-helicase domain-containing protein [Bacteroidaceae bacterium]
MMRLEDLNESQQQAVLCCDSPSLVIAGAGSGKTRVLTYKIAYLLQQGMQPYNILALTFTNKAAKEMRQRIAKILGEEIASQLWMGTFHSIFSRILRRESVTLGFSPDFTIYDASDCKSLIKTIIKEMQLDDKAYKPGSVAARISLAKNSLILPSAYQADRRNFESDLHAKMPAIGEIYMRYWNRCRQANTMDFDDLLLYTWILFSEYPDIAQRWEDRFHFVLVDEYQDTNYAQHQIVWLLTQHRQRVSVVGDDAQSIYSFRGANIDNILRFQERYQGAKLFKLEQNYRSTQTIVSAANSLIAHNRGQIRKEVFSKNDVGEPIRLLQTYSDIDEANAVMRCVREFYRNEQIPYNQIAILYRTNAQSRSFEEVMRKNAIPYRVYGGTSFYQRKEIKDVIAYLRLIVNPRDEEALRRVINYPTRGIGQTTLDKIYKAAQQHDLTPWDILSAPHLLDVSASTRTKLSTFSQMISSLHERQLVDNAHNIALDIVTLSGMRAEINKGREPEDISRQENLQELVDGIAVFVSERTEQGQDALLSSYLQEVSLMSDVDENESVQGEDRITLMTVHSAKGLEFRVVFIVGMEEELFPSSMSSDSPRQLEEERRLFYVAITRAEEYLVITNAKSRFRYGKTEMCKPSRFLREIDPLYIRISGISSGNAILTSAINNVRPSASIITTPPSARPSVSSTSATPTGADARRFVRVTPSLHSSPQLAASHPAANTSNLSVGTKILHERFGHGIITAIEGNGIDTKATVLFENVGTKQLLLRFAKFKVI